MDRLEEMARRIRILRQEISREEHEMQPDQSALAWLRRRLREEEGALRSGGASVPLQP